MRRRVLLGFVAMVAVVLGVLEIPLAINYAHRQEDQLTAKVERDAFFLASYVDDRPSPGDQQVLAAVAGYTRTTGGRVVLIDHAGQVLVDTDPPEPGPRSMADRPEMASALKGSMEAGTRHSTTLGGDYIFVAVPITRSGTNAGALRVSYPRSTVDQAIVRYRLTLAVVAAVALLVAVVIGLLLARSVVGPLEQVRAAAVRFGHGERDVRAPEERGPKEVRQVAAAFNDTAGRLEALLGSQEAFVADASHQLRTPLTALRLRIENLQADARPEGAEDLRAAAAEVERSSHLVDGLLALARSDREAGGATVEPVDVVALLHDRADAWAPVADEQGVRIEVAAPPGAQALATPGRLEQVVDNLVANALAQSTSGTVVSLGATTDDRWLELRITDQGPGLAEADRARAFDRFWRGPDPGGAHLGGSGLGLAIVRNLVVADRGTIELVPGPDGRGLSAVVRLASPPEA